MTADQLEQDVMSKMGELGWKAGYHPPKGIEVVDVVCNIVGKSGVDYQQFRMTTRTLNTFTYRDGIQDMILHAYRYGHKDKSEAAIATTNLDSIMDTIEDNDFDDDFDNE